MMRQMNGAWVAALATSVMLMAAQANGAGKGPAKKPAAAPKHPTMTVTGCLRVDGNQYRLTNLKGSEGKGRNWKSGYMMKTTKNVELVGTSPNVRLIDHVGREVSVVGTADDDTHLRATSIKRVATSCSVN